MLLILIFKSLYIFHSRFTFYDKYYLIRLISDADLDKQDKNGYTALHCKIYYQL